MHYWFLYFLLQTIFCYYFFSHQILCNKYHFYQITLDHYQWSLSDTTETTLFTWFGFYIPIPTSLAAFYNTICHHNKICHHSEFKRARFVIHNFVSKNLFCFISLIGRYCFLSKIERFRTITETEIVQKIIGNHENLEYLIDLNQSFCYCFFLIPHVYTNIWLLQGIVV